MVKLTGKSCMNEAEIKNIVLYGAGVVAQCAISYFRDDPRYNIRALVVDEKYWTKKSILGLPIYSYTDFKNKLQKSEIFLNVCMGYSELNYDRQSVCERLQNDGWELCSLIHSINKIDDCSFGSNTIIFPNCNIQPFVKMGMGNIIWPGSMIGHHSKIGDFNWFTSHSLIGGHAKIGNNNFFGLGSVVMNNVQIKNTNIINANCTIDKCTETGDVYMHSKATKHRMKSTAFVKLTKFGQ